MASLNEAWRVLSDPARRAMYDAALRDRRPSTNGSSDADWERRLGQMVATDDDVDFTPAAPWQRRIPLWAMLILGTLAAIFLITAYAGSGRIGTKLPKVPVVDGAIAVGSCVRLASGGVAEEIDCSAPNDGTVVATIGYDGRCPAGSSGYRRRDAVAGYACVSHR